MVTRITTYKGRSSNELYHDLRRNGCAQGYFSLCCYNNEKEKAEYPQKVKGYYSKVFNYIEAMRFYYGDNMRFICGYEAGYPWVPAVSPIDGTRRKIYYPCFQRLCHSRRAGRKLKQTSGMLNLLLSVWLIATTVRYIFPQNEMSKPRTMSACGMTISWPSKSKATDSLVLPVS